MSVDLAPRPLPLLTADLPGTGGEARVAPEDFEVEEVPAYLPAGVGEHLYLWVEKRDLTTAEAARMLAQALGENPRDVGYAGQKDRRAVTRQWFSILTKRDDVTIDDPRLRVLDVKRHGNKLRLGHLRANRFTLRIQGVVPDALARAQAIVEVLQGRGLANFYGSQRFGRDGDNAQLGAALLGLTEHRMLERARKDRFLRRLAVSALQSELFNRVVAERLADGLFDEVIDGDVLRKRDSGGVFVSTDAQVDGERARRREVDVTGPMPGHRERPAAQGLALERETRVLQAAGVPRAAFERAGGEAEGARRPMRVPLTDVAITQPSPDVLELQFALPPGSYATRVLAEVMKADVALPGED